MILPLIAPASGGAALPPKRTKFSRNKSAKILTLNYFLKFELNVKKRLLAASFLKLSYVIKMPNGLLKNPSFCVIILRCMISDSHSINLELEPACIETGERPVRHLTVVGVVGGTVLDSVRRVEDENRADTFTAVDPENDSLVSAIGEVDKSLEHTEAAVKAQVAARSDVLEVLREKQEAAVRRQDFDALYHLTHQKITRLLATMLGREDAAMEVTQESFLRVWKGLPGFRGESSVYTWITNIAMNEADRYSRKKRHRYESSEEATSNRTQGQDDSATLALVNVETAISVRGRLAEATMRLTPALRDTVMLRYVQELSVEETAAVLGISEGTVKVRTSRGASQLRELLEDLDPSVTTRDTNTGFRSGSTKNLGDRAVTLSSDILAQLDGAGGQDTAMLREAVVCFSAGMSAKEVARRTGINQTALRRKLGGIIEDVERERLSA